MHHGYAFVHQTIADTMTEVEKKQISHTRITRSGEVEHVLSHEKEVTDNEWDHIPVAYSNLGFYLVVPILLGLGTGLVLDRKLGTRVLFTISLIVIGTVSAFYNLYKLYSDDESTHKH